MKLDDWIKFLKQSYQKNGKELSQEKIKFLIQTIPNEDFQKPDQFDNFCKKYGLQKLLPRLDKTEQSICDEMTHVLTLEFFDRLVSGIPFGNVEKLSADFQNCLEKHKNTHKSFVKMCVVCGTFLEEVQELFPDYHDIILPQVLQNISFELKGLFLPTDGPNHVPLKKRISAQRQVLNKYAPEFDIEDFVTNNPILSHEKSKEAVWPSFIYLLIFLIIAAIIPQEKLWGKFVFYAFVFMIVISIFSIYKSLMLRFKR